MSASKDADHHGAPDDVRRKFKEALERKQGKRSEHAVGGPNATGQAHTAPAKAQRTFRRKSG